MTVLIVILKIKGKMADSYTEDRPTWNAMKTPMVMERLRTLYESSKWHDCVFKLWNSDHSREELVFAHNLILATSSPVFEALCYGPMANQNIIEVTDIDPVAFQLMLKFIYTDFIEFTSVELACNVLYASKKYLIYTLVGFAISYIENNLNESNCLQIYEYASFIQEEGLIKSSWNFLCSHLEDVFEYITYDTVSRDLVKKLVNEEALNGGEIIVFKICLIYAKAECENRNWECNGENLRKILIDADVFNKIRWLTLSPKEFEEVPVESGILTSDEIKFISEVIILNNNDAAAVLKSNNNFLIESESDDVKLTMTKGSEIDILKNKVIDNFCSFNNNKVLKPRKKIQLKKFYCHRLIEKTKVCLSPPLEEVTRKVFTYVTVNKQVRLSGLFIIAQIIPVGIIPDHSKYSEKGYQENLSVIIYDNNTTLFSTKFQEKVAYGTTFKIALSTPVLLKKFKEYTIQVDLLNTINYKPELRDSVLKFPSGLCFTFGEQMSCSLNEDKRFKSFCSIITGLELDL